MNPHTCNLLILFLTILILIILLHTIYKNNYKEKFECNPDDDVCPRG